jgi:hypothetical protein
MLPKWQRGQLDLYITISACSIPLEYVPPMILPDNVADAKRQQQQPQADAEAQHTSQSRLLSQPPPPAYNAGPSHVVYKPYQPGGYDEQDERWATRAARRRFLRAFLVAGGIWLLIGMLSGSIADLSRWRHSHNVRFLASQNHNAPQTNLKFMQGSSGSPSPPSSEVGWPEASDGHIDQCVRGGGWSDARPYPGDHERRIRTTFFQLPMNADHLFLLSRGAISHGSVDIVQGHHSDADAHVEVSVIYWLQDMLEKASVCRLSREGSEHGVGIFVRANLLRGAS